jgi:hypothetical protein
MGPAVGLCEGIERETAAIPAFHGSHLCYSWEYNPLGAAGRGRGRGRGRGGIKVNQAGQLNSNIINQGGVVLNNNWNFNLGVDINVDAPNQGLEVNFHHEDEDEDED